MTRRNAATAVREPLTHLLAACNVLSAALPTSGTRGAGTRRELTPQLDAINAVLREAGVEELSPSAGLDMFNPDGPTVTLMGTAVPDDLASRAAAVMTEAGARGARQAEGLVTWALTLRSDRLTRFVRGELKNLIDAVRIRAGVITTSIATWTGAAQIAGSRLRDFLVRWAELSLGFWNDAVSALVTGVAVGVGGGTFLFWLLVAWVISRMVK